MGLLPLNLSCAISLQYQSKPLLQPLLLSLSATRVTTLWLKQFVFTVMSLFKYTKLPYIRIRP